MINEMEDRIDNATAFSILEFICKTIPGNPNRKPVSQLTNIVADDIRDIRSTKIPIRKEHRKKVDRTIQRYIKENKFNPDLFFQSIYRVLNLQESGATEIPSDFVTQYAKKLGVDILRASDNGHLLNHQMIVFRQSMVNINQFVMGTVELKHDYNTDTIMCYIKITSEKFGITDHGEFQKGILCRNNNTLTMICESDDHKGSASFQNALFKWNVHPMSQTTNDNYMGLSGDMSAETCNKKDDFSFVITSRTDAFNESFDVEANLGQMLNIQDLPIDVQDSLKNHTSFRSFYNDITPQAA